MPFCIDSKLWLNPAALQEFTFWRQKFNSVFDSGFYFIISSKIKWATHKLLNCAVPPVMYLMKQRDSHWSNFDLNDFLRCGFLSQSLLILSLSLVCFIVILLVFAHFDVSNKSNFRSHRIQLYFKKWDFVP